MSKIIKTYLQVPVLNKISDETFEALKENWTSVPGNHIEFSEFAEKTQLPIENSQLQIVGGKLISLADGLFAKLRSFNPKEQGLKSFVAIYGKKVTFIEKKDRKEALKYAQYVFDSTRGIVVKEVESIL